MSNMKIMNYMKTIALALAFVLAIGACSNQAEPIKDDEQGQRSVPAVSQSILLTLEGQEAQYTSVDAIGSRAVAFEISATGPKLKMTEEKVESVAVIANQDQSTTYYVKIEWDKEAGKNRLFVRNYEIKQDLDGNPLNLDTNQTWYIMGYVGGTYDHSTKRVSYNPNGSALQSGANGEVIKKAVPIFFPWTELQVKQYGSYQLALSGLDRINFKTLGTILRVTLKNSFGQDVRIKNLRLLSNSLRTTSGYYKLGKTDLPAISTTTLPQFTFETALSTSSGNYYRSMNEPVYTLQTNDGVATNIDLTSGATFDKSFLIWAMPDVTATARPVTHLLADVARLKNGVEQNAPKMETLYVWGTNRVFAERSRQLLSANVLRSKMSLEYFAPDYVGYGEMVGTNGLAPSRSTIDKGIPLFTYSQIQQPNILKGGWRVPMYQDARGMFMVDLSDVAHGSHSALAFKGSTARRTISQSVRVNGELATYTDVYQMGASIYALRFANRGNGQKLYSAWRYSYNNAATKGALIEAVYLGPNFKGTIDDIVDPYFWTIHKNDVITRQYTSSTYYYDDRIGWKPVSLVNFWAIYESVPELSPGQRVWGFGHDANWYMGHIQHYEVYTNTPHEHIAHIIPLEPIGSLWKDNN